MLPLLSPVLAALPTGPGALVALLAAASAYAVLNRDVDAHVSVR